MNAADWKKVGVALLTASILGASATLWAHEGKLTEIAASLPYLIVRVDEMRADQKELIRRIDEHLSQDRLRP